MEQSIYLRALDEHFCAHYSDYVKIAAIEGYVMPELLYIAKDGNIARRDPSRMRICYQPDPARVLAAFKAGLTDTGFTFSFRFRTLREKFGDFFSRRRKTFARALPDALSRCGETAESAGAKLAVEERFWRMLTKGKVYPEKGTVLALALVCHMSAEDAGMLLDVCGFPFDMGDVRDVVVDFLLAQRVYNAGLRDACLAEYKIASLPIR